MVMEGARRPGRWAVGPAVTGSAAAWGGLILSRTLSRHGLPAGAGGATPRRQQR